MPAEFEAELSELLGLRLMRAFQDLPSDLERLRVVEYVEALNSGAQTTTGPFCPVTSNRERDEQADLASGKDHLDPA